METLLYSAIQFFEEGVSMAVRCSDVLEINSLKKKKLKVVAGHKGLNRIVRWVHISDCPQAKEFVKGGELLFITGIGIKSNAELLKLIEGIEAKHLAGLVINVGPYIQRTPEEAITLAESLAFPIFELPWEVRLVDVTQTICRLIMMKQIEEETVSDLIENIIINGVDCPETLLKRATLYGYDLTKPYQAAVINIDDSHCFRENDGFKDRNGLLEVMNCVKQIALNVLANYGKKALSMFKNDDSLILFVPVGEERDTQKIKKLFDEIRQSVVKQMYGVTVSIGLGSCYPELKDLKKSLQEAEQALKAVRANNAKDTTCSFQDLGLYKIILNVTDQQKLLAFYQDTLGSLMNYDKRYNTDLMKTLEVYLAKNGNLNKAAKRLFIHRNTLKYRLQRIEEISGCNLSDAYHRLNVQVGLMVAKFLNMSN